MEDLRPRFWAGKIVGIYENNAAWFGVWTWNWTHTNGLKKIRAGTDVGGKALAFVGYYQNALLTGFGKWQRKMCNRWSSKVGEPCSFCLCSLELFASTMQKWCELFLSCEREKALHRKDRWAILYLVSVYLCVCLAIIHVNIFRQLMFTLMWYICTEVSVFAYKIIYFDMKMFL